MTTTSTSLESPKTVVTRQSRFESAPIYLQRHGSGGSDFKYFPRLPAELRIAIWKGGEQGRKIIHLKFKEPEAITTSTQNVEDALINGQTSSSPPRGMTCRWANRDACLGVMRASFESREAVRRLHSDLRTALPIADDGDTLRGKGASHVDYRASLDEGAGDVCYLENFHREHIKYRYPDSIEPPLDFMSQFTKLLVPLSELYEVTRQLGASLPDERLGLRYNPPIAVRLMDFWGPIIGTTMIPEYKILIDQVATENGDSMKGRDADDLRPIVESDLTPTELSQLQELATTWREWGMMGLPVAIWKEGSVLGIPIRPQVVTWKKATDRDTTYTSCGLWDFV